MDDARLTLLKSRCNVERYVLPKFKVAVDFSGDGASERGYRPGDHVTGTVRANYFFGKPVDGAEVTVKASGDGRDAVRSGVGARQDRCARARIVSTSGCPNISPGRPLSQGAARVLIEATVKDAAGHCGNARRAHHGERVAACSSRRFPKAAR